MIIITNLPRSLFLHFRFPQDNFIVNTLKTKRNPLLKELASNLMNQ